MKKSNLYVGFAYLLVGIGCFVMLGLTHYHQYEVYVDLLRGIGGRHVYHRNPYLSTSE